jgi:hypothetical protein
MHATPEHFAAAHHGNERRAKPRHAPKTLAYVNVGDANGGVIVDISETGMSIASAEPLEPNAAPRLRFQLPHIDRTFEVSAETVWTADSKTKAGVRFVSMPIDERVQIRNWIKDELFAEAFPTRVASTMVPRRRLPFTFETMAEAAAGSASDPREQKPHLPAKVLPDIPVTIPSHTMDAFEKMFPSESTLGPHIVKRAEHVLVAPSQADIDTAALWMNFPSERDVAPRVVEFNEETIVKEDAAPAPVAEDTPSMLAHPEFVSESVAPTAIAAPEVQEHIDALVDELACELVVEQAANSGAIEETVMHAPVEVVVSNGRTEETAVAAHSVETPQLAPESFKPHTVETSASAVNFAPATQAISHEPKVAAETAVAAPAEAAAATPEILPPPVSPVLAVSEFEVALLPTEAPLDEPSEVPIHELHPLPEGPAFAASQMDALDISQAVRTPGKFSGGAVSDASIESLLAIAEAEEASAPLPRKPLRVVRDQKPAQPRAAMPAQPVAKIIPVAAAIAPLPHVALRSTAQQSATPQKLTDGDKQFRGLLIAAAIVLLALCFVVGYSHNVQLPWMNKANKSSDSAPANTAPAKTDPSAAPATDSAPSPSSQTTPDLSSPTSQASNNAPAANDPASQSRLPDSASIAPSSKFEAPALPATPTPPPSSYFPVTAPAEGSAPRMVELPEKTVFDAPKVLIRLRQYFFVPPQPGPEWSHKLGQILVGEPMLKMPPSPTSDADSSVVHLRATFGKDGAVKNVRPIDGPVALLPRSVDAVRQWRYQPSVLDGQPVEWQGDFTIEFRPAS